MVDFWLTLGTMITDPRLLEELGTPRFTPVPTRLIEKVPGKRSVTIVINSAGHLEEEATRRMRSDLQSALGRLYPDAKVPVSLYAAGKLCQLLSLHREQLSPAVSQANVAWKKAVTESQAAQPLSPQAVSLMGASLVDGDLAAALRDAAGKTAAQNFFVDPDNSSPEWRLVESFVNQDDFKAAQTTLLSASTWDHGCRERLFFYDRFIRAVS